MFDVGWPELLVIMGVALLVFGPQRMVELARTAGKALREFRQITNEFSGTFTDMIQETPATARPAAPTIAPPAPTNAPAEAAPAPAPAPVFDHPLTVPPPIATPPDDYDPADQSMPNFPDEPALPDTHSTPPDPAPEG